MVFSSGAAGERIRVGKTSLNVVRAGDGPAVVLLHGFPDLGFGFRHQTEALIAQGYQVVVPDLRGYGNSDKPEAVEAYRWTHLLDDLIGLRETLELDRIAVVGHDWGGLLGLLWARAEPSHVCQLVLMNAPHPELYRKRLPWPDQLPRAWYALLCQLPLLPEALLRRRAVLRWIYRTTSNAPLSEAELDVYWRAFRQPGATRGPLNYYRAALRWPLRMPERLDLPVLVLWGDRDVALSSRVLRGIERYLPRVEVRRFPAANHFVQLDASAEVNTALIDFLRAHHEVGSSTAHGTPPAR
jgi:pimeloyl-ACP methyl ester carboxylesterase